MAFNTYAEGYRIASDLANKAILTESSLSSLAPLASPLPTLQRAFPLYISAAETYSHLITAKSTPAHEKEGIKKKWRLVLDRAEKVKTRIEELGGQVGRVDTADELVESQVLAIGGQMNGLDLQVWREPYKAEFELKGGKYEEERRTELAQDQLDLGAEWADLEASAWKQGEAGERIVVTQGAGADCSVVAGMTVCLEHNRRWKRQLAREAFYPRTDEGEPRRSENGKHVVRLLLNGCWRSVIIDALLPRRTGTHHPLHATSQPLSSLSPSSPSSSTPNSPSPALSIGAPWVPLALKAFFKAHGGYSLAGSNPAPDIYAFTGWIPERCTLQSGFQREKEWGRVYGAWKRGEVLVTLGSGKEGVEGLVPLHAYAVLDLRAEEGQRVVDVFDPGLPAETKCDLVRAMADATIGMNRKTGLFTMSWDAVCQAFEALHLNWDPALKPVAVKKHWSWAKPSDASAKNQPRYRLTLTTPSKEEADREVWILLSQHLVSKERALDDIALHVYEEHDQGGASLDARPITSNPYSNAQHVLVRYTPRDVSSTLLILPSRDRGIGRTDFTLQAFASQGSTLHLERIDRPLTYSMSVSSAITARSAGGHSGWPDYGINPQYRLIFGETPASGSGLMANGRAGKVKEVRVELSGDTGVAWNVKLLWSSGELVHDVTSDAVITDSGPHSFGLAVASTRDISCGTYTLAVSAFQPGQTGKFELSVDASVPVKLEGIPQEGAGMYRRTCEGEWTEDVSGGRPSTGSYHLNPQIELILSRPLSIQCRLHQPPSLPPLSSSLNASGTYTPRTASHAIASSAPQSAPSPTESPPSPQDSPAMNLTLFSRAPGGRPGSEQISTSGPYSDATSGVRIKNTKVGKEGVYVLVPSLFDRHAGAVHVHANADGAASGEMRRRRWRVDVWADGPFEMDRVR